MATAGVPRSCAALVLAADMQPGNDLAVFAGVENKCLAEAGGQPLLAHVLTALRHSHYVTRICISTNTPELLRSNVKIATLLEEYDAELIPSASSAPESVIEAVRRLPESLPLMVTTGDNVMLTAEMVDYFWTEAEHRESEVMAGIVAAGLVLRCFPNARRTFIRLGEESYSGCNLFAFKSQGALRAAEFWHIASKSRKKPLHLAWHFGIAASVLYILNHLTPRTAAARISKVLGVGADFIVMPFGEAAMDVDRISDLVAIRRTFSDGGEGPS